MGRPLVTVEVTGTQSVVRGSNIHLICTASVPSSTGTPSSGRTTTQSLLWVKDGHTLNYKVTHNPKSLLFYCGTLPASYTADQRRILFYKKLIHHSSSILVRTIARLCQYDILSVADKYGIYRLDNSVGLSFIKKSVWKTFAASAV